MANVPAGISCFSVQTRGIFFISIVPATRIKNEESSGK
jgi:hypothetical protein